MAQRLPNYLLIGSGRLATHLRFYFSSKEIPIEQWTRKDGEARLKAALAQADTVLLAISDAAISSFVSRADFQGKTIVHFAGARHFQGAWGFHPLMTFSEKLYDLSFYSKIPFVADFGFPARTVFPFLTNPVYEIDPAQKPLYHALCHMAANFPALLWVHVIKTFETELNLPRAVLAPILEKIQSNVFADGEKALAGPLRRGDFATLNLHKDALTTQPTLAEINRLWTTWATSFPTQEKTL